MWLWTSRQNFRKKNYEGFPRCARLGTSPRKGQSPLASTHRTPALRSDASQCHHAAKRQHKEVNNIFIWVNCNSFPTERFVVRSFVFMRQKGMPKKKYFTKVQRAFSYFRRMQNSLFWSYFLQLLSRIGNPKSQSISRTRVLNSAVLSSAHLVENVFPHSLMLCFPQAHTCIWLLLYMYVQCSSIAVHYWYIGSDGI